MLWVPAALDWVRPLPFLSLLIYTFLHLKLRFQKVLFLPGVQCDNQLFYLVSQLFFLSEQKASFQVEETAVFPKPCTLRPSTVKTGLGHQAV